MTTLHTRVIAIGNQKGGVGKTTTTVNLAAALCAMNRKVLIIDLDMNRGTTRQFKIASDTLAGAFEVMLGVEDPLNVAIKNADLEEGEGTLPDNLHIIVANRNLEHFEQVLSARNKMMASQDVLLKPIDQLRGHYDYVLLDTAPNLTAPTLAAYKAADFFILSAMPNPLAVSGLEDALQDIRSTRDVGNSKLRLLGIVLSCVDERTNIAKELLAFVRQTFSVGPPSSRAYKTMVSRSVKVDEAQNAGMTVLQYDPEHKIAQQYRELAKELESRLAMLELDQDQEKGPAPLQQAHG